MWTIDIRLTDPMLAYHFLNDHCGLENLRHRRLKISEIAQLNDPFEFLGVDLTDIDFRKALKKTKAAISETKGILCFSKDWKIPLLWDTTQINIKAFAWGLKSLIQF